MAVDADLQAFLMQPAPTPSPEALRMIAKEAFTNEALVKLIVERPDYTHLQLASHFGRGLGWFAFVLATDSFQEALQPYVNLVNDPTLTATMEERLRGLAIRGLEVLQRKMDSEGVSDLIVLKAAEIGIKGLGLGNAAPLAAPLAGKAPDIAERLLAALEKQRRNVVTVDMSPVQEAVLVEDSSIVP